MAFGEKVYLAAWREGWAGKNGRARIFASRVSADGKNLDPRGIPIVFAGQGLQDRPRVAFGGGVFLVVWQEFNGKHCTTLAARVGLDGKVLDSRPIAVALARGRRPCRTLPPTAAVSWWSGRGWWAKRPATAALPPLSAPMARSASPSRPAPRRNRRLPGTGRIIWWPAAARLLVRRGPRHPVGLRRQAGRPTDPGARRHQGRELFDLGRAG